MRDLKKDSLVGKVFIGTVVANAGAPNGQNFVRVRIPEIDGDTTERPDNLLPWSGVGRPLFRGGDTKSGMGSIPKVGTQVAGICDKGNRDSFIALWEIENPGTRISDWNINTWGMQDEEGSAVKCEVGGNMVITHRGTTITIDQSGNTDVQIAGNLTMRVAGTADINVSGQMTATAPNTILNTELLLNGNMTIAGNITQTGGSSGGGTATFSGSVHATGDVTSGSISLQHHKHTCPDGTTSEPIA